MTPAERARGAAPLLGAISKRHPVWPVLKDARGLSRHLSLSSVADLSHVERLVAVAYLLGDRDGAIESARLLDDCEFEGNWDLWSCVQVVRTVAARALRERGDAADADAMVSSVLREDERFLAADQVALASHHDLNAFYAECYGGLREACTWRLTSWSWMVRCSEIPWCPGRDDLSVEVRLMAPQLVDDINLAGRRGRARRGEGVPVVEEPHDQFNAALRGTLEGFKALYDGDPNARTPLLGRTLLFLALSGRRDEEERLRIVRFLVSEGADVSAPIGGYGLIPLGVGLRTGLWRSGEFLAEVVRLLTGAGADPNVSGRGSSPMAAVLETRGMTADVAWPACEALMDAGADWRVGRAAPGGGRMLGCPEIADGLLPGFGDRLREWHPRTSP